MIKCVNRVWWLVDHNGNEYKLAVRDCGKSVEMMFENKERGRLFYVLNYDEDLLGFTYFEELADNFITLILTSDEFNNGVSQVITNVLDMLVFTIKTSCPIREAVWVEEEQGISEILKQFKNNDM